MPIKMRSSEAWNLPEAARDITINKAKYKAGDRSRGQIEGFLFISYYNKV